MSNRRKRAEIGIYRRKTLTTGAIFGYPPLVFVEERLEQFLNLLGAHGSMTVEQAVELTGVSADTVRRDFNRLAERGLVVRTHGGIVHRDTVAPDSPIRERRVQNAAQKALIAHAAASMVVDHETIALDAGTTTVGMIEHLTRLQNLTVITYSLDLAGEVVRRANMTAVILGGMIRESTLSVVGPEAIAMVKSFHANTLFLAANGLSEEHGLLTPNRMEAEVKRALIDSADRVVLLLDSSKIGRRALVSFAPVDAVSTLVTDAGADEAFCDRIRARGIEVVIAE